MDVKFDAHSYVPLFVSVMTPVLDSENQMIILLLYFYFLKMQPVRLRRPNTG